MDEDGVVAPNWRFELLPTHETLDPDPSAHMCHAPSAVCRSPPNGAVTMVGTHVGLVVCPKPSWPKPLPPQQDMIFVKDEHIEDPVALAQIF